MKDADGKISWVKVSLKYIPIQMELDPSESINNMGNLRVDVLDAQDLPAADSNGKSDPYVKFALNGEDVFKTKVQKKTLQPAWNEFFETPVHSRTAAEFKATVWDWDFADKPDHLGSTMIDLSQLEPFTAHEARFPLDGKSGSLRLRLLFRPDYVTRMGQGTSTFSGTFATPGKIVTGVAGAPIKGGVAVAGVMGHTVGKGASFFKRGITNLLDRDSSSAAEVPTITTNGTDPAPGTGLKRATGLGADGDATLPEESAPPGPANGAGYNHARTRSMGASSIRSALVPGASSGTASFNVISASGFPAASDVYVAIHQAKDGKAKVVGKTKHRKAQDGVFKFDETFSISCTPDSPFKVEAKENHTFSSDDDLGEGLYFVDESNSGQEKEVKVGSGSVVIKSTFTPTPTESILTTESPRSGLRRSFLSKRE